MTLREFIIGIAAALLFGVGMFALLFWPSRSGKR